MSEMNWFGIYPQGSDSPARKPGRIQIAMKGDKPGELNHRCVQENLPKRRDVQTEFCGDRTGDVWERDAKQLRQHCNTCEDILETLPSATKS